MINSMNEAIRDNKGKTGYFSTYFIIYNDKFFSTNNFYFESNLKSCFYIKKLGSNVHPIILVDIKDNGKWIAKNKLIGDYYNFMDFIYEHLDCYICIRGFSHASMAEFIRFINKSKRLNITYIK